MIDRSTSSARLRSRLCTAALFPVLLLIPVEGEGQAGTELVDDLQRMVRFLASDELEGRRTGTRGNLLAAGFIAGEFASIGLEPVGNGYLHNFSYLKSISVGDPNSLSLWGGGPGAPGTGGTPPRNLVLDREFRPLGFSSGGWYSGEVVFVGYGISAPDEGYDDYEGVDVQGKIALMFRYSPDGDDVHGLLSEYGTFVSKMMTAREKGAVGVLIVDLSGEEDLVPFFMMRGYRDAGLGAVSIHPDVLTTFRDPSGSPIDFVGIAATIDSTRRPNSFAIEQAKASFTVTIDQDIVDAPNVLGMIPGTDPALKHEIIVVGAHFDHLGHGGAGSLHRDHAPAIHNGADDNASGTSAVIALAERWRERGQNRRTLIFMAFNGEEDGLLGSSHLVENAPFDVSNVVAMINLDMVGRMKDGEVVVQGTGTSGAWESILAPDNLDDAGDLTLKRVPDGYGPSDHSSFYGRQIPVLFFFTRLHDDYHRPSDDWNLVNYDGIARIVNLVDGVVGKIDALETRPDYIDVPRRSPGANVRLKVVLGIMPDYGYGGDGLRITDVSSGGAAEKGGLQGGDVIIRLDGKDVNGIEAYMNALKSVKPNDQVEVVVMRGESELTLTVVPTGRE